MLLLRPSLAALVAIAALAAPAPAQDAPSSGELEARFQAQLLEGEKTRSLGKTEKHRGLVIAVPEARASQNAALKEVEFVPVPEEYRIDLLIAFDLNSSELRPDQHDKLAEMCKAMQSMSDTRFRIIGHTDASGSETYNDTLSVYRSEAVRRNLTDECGIGSDRLEAIGVGERYLADPEAPTSDLNRRVEFQALG